MHGHGQQAATRLAPSPHTMYVPVYPHTIRRDVPGRLSTPNKVSYETCTIQVSGPSRGRGIQRDCPGRPAAAAAPSYRAARRPATEGVLNEMRAGNLYDMWVPGCSMYGCHWSMEYPCFNVPPILEHDDRSSNAWHCVLTSVRNPCYRGCGYGTVLVR